MKKDGDDNNNNNNEKKKKKKKKNKIEVDKDVVENIVMEFKLHFTEVQVRDTLLNNKNDIDKTMSDLKYRKDKADS